MAYWYNSCHERNMCTDILWLSLFSHIHITYARCVTYYMSRKCMWFNKINFTVYNVNHATPTPIQDNLESVLFKSVLLVSHKSKLFLPLRYSIQLCTVSGGSVSFICFKASSSKTSPVGVSLLTSNLRFSRLLRLMPAFSNSMRPRMPNSMRIHPRSPLDMQSFQNDV